jgi:peptidoglycan/LPS O-acetylase OafA/YrhL
VTIPVSTRIPSLDGLRAISVIFVILAHLRPTLEAQFPGGHALIRILAGCAGLGVSVFFVISGYLITRLLIKERVRSGRVDLPAFYRRRALRILPVFYTYVAIVTALTVLGFLRLGPKDLLNAALFVTNYKHLWTPVDGPDYWIVGHFWTLSLEEQFYLFWPLLFAAISPLRARRTALALILIMPVMRLGAYFLTPGSRGQLNLMFHTGIDTIMAGCLVALWEEDGLPRVADAVFNSGWATLGALGLLFFPIDPLFGRYAGGFGLTGGKLVMIVCIVVVIMHAIRQAGSPVGRVLNSRLLVHVGVLSYSLYIWQQMFLDPFEANHRWFGQFPCVVAVIFIVAQLSHTFIEQPFIRLRRRREAAPPETSSRPVAD